MRGGFGRLSREVRILLLMPEYEMGGAETQFRYFIERAEENNWKLDVIIEQRVSRDSILLKNDLKRMKNVRFYRLHGYRTETDKMSWRIIVQIFKNLFKSDTGHA